MGVARKASSTQVRNQRWLMQECPFSITLFAVGNRWGAVVLYKLIERAYQFGGLRDVMPLVSEKVLAAELKRLQALGLVEKRTRSTRPRRVEFVLTARGRSLEPVLNAMQRWGEGQRTETVTATVPEVEFLESSSE